MRARICPNPKCQRMIEAPILLNNFSETPAERYYACPYCFIKLEINSRRTILVGLLLTVFGSITMAWVGQLIWHDIIVWGKDIVLIFFGSRTGENIGLGIGMKVIHYFLIGLALFLSGLVTFFVGRRSKTIRLHHSMTTPEKEKAGTHSRCPYNFGYLKKLDQDTPIPDECLRCSRMRECSSFNPARSSARASKLEAGM